MAIRGKFTAPALAANGVLANESVAPSDGFAFCKVKATGGSNNVCAFTMPEICGAVPCVRVVNGTSGEAPAAGYTITFTDTRSGNTWTLSAAAQAGNQTFESSNESQSVVGFFTGPVSCSIDLPSGKSCTLTVYANAS